MFNFSGKLGKYFLVLGEARAMELYQIKNPKSKPPVNKMTAYKRAGEPLPHHTTAKK
jgi:hypothetical protein